MRSLRIYSKHTFSNWNVAGQCMEVYFSQVILFPGAIAHVSTDFYTKITTINDHDTSNPEWCKRVHFKSFSLHSWQHFLGHACQFACALNSHNFKRCISLLVLIKYQNRDCGSQFILCVCWSVWLCLCLLHSVSFIFWNKNLCCFAFWFKRCG